MAKKDQAYCRGCEKAFGLTSRRSYYNGFQFHHTDFNPKCVEDYKKKHPPLTRRQRLGRFVLASLPFLGKTPPSEGSVATTGLPQAGD